METKTWKLDLERNCFCGKIDGVEALKQAIYFILNTERFRYVIHSWKYGVELDALIGEQRTKVEALLSSRIKEALVEDTRIKDVGDFSMTWNRREVLIKFVVDSIYGKTDVDWEVSL